MDWQETTIETTKRLRDVLSIAPISETLKLGLYAEARAIASVASAGDPKRFWNIFLNVLRIFIGAEGGVITKDRLYKEIARSKERAQCPARRRVRGTEIPCSLYDGHAADHDFGG